MMYWIDYHFPWCCIRCCEVNERLVNLVVASGLRIDPMRRGVSLCDVS